MLEIFVTIGAAALQVYVVPLGRALWFHYVFVSEPGKSGFGFKEVCRSTLNDKLLNHSSQEVSICIYGWGEVEPCAGHLVRDRHGHFGCACPKSMVKSKECIAFVNVTDQKHRTLVHIPSANFKNVHHSQLVFALSSEMAKHMSFGKVTVFISCSCSREESCSCKMRRVVPAICQHHCSRSKENCHRNEKHIPVVNKAVPASMKVAPVLKRDALEYHNI